MGPDGALNVADWGNGRISRFVNGSAFERTIPMPGSPTWVAPVAGGFIVSMRGRLDRLAMVDTSGRIVREFASWPKEVQDVPYWGSITAAEVAVGAGRVFVASSLIYAVSVYSESGDSLGTFGTPPKSWAAASRPARGAFVGPSGMARAAEWLKTFTVISSLAVYRDSLLVVAHARPGPDVVNFNAQVPNGVDVYGVDGAGIAWDASLKGRVLAGGQYLYVLASEPPDGWAIAAYRITLSSPPPGRRSQ